MFNQKEKLNKDDQGQETVVTEHNSQMLNHDMLRLLEAESIGGNAGSIEIDGKKYSCAAANGFANPDTGEIIMFGNIQDIPRDIVKNNIGFTLRVAMDWQKGGFFKIVHFFVSSHDKKEFSTEGKLVIESAINKWNGEHEQ